VKARTDQDAIHQIESLVSNVPTTVTKTKFHPGLIGPIQAKIGGEKSFTLPHWIPIGRWSVESSKKAICPARGIGFSQQKPSLGIYAYKL